MNTANNSLRQDTDRRIREALLFFMEQEKEPSVSNICEHAQINRSTFYRHYTDVPELMEKTEREIQSGLVKSLNTEEGKSSLDAFASGMIEPLIRYVGEHRAFYRTYFRSHSSFTLEPGFRRYWEQTIRPLFLSVGVETETRMRYYYEYFQSGVVSVLKLWLDGNCSESPEEIAGILRNMIGQSVHKSYDSRLR